MKLTITAAFLFAVTTPAASAQQSVDPTRPLATPAVEDPVGSNFQISTMLDATDTAVAYDPISRRYLVAFAANTSSCSEVVVRLISADGTVLGPDIPIAPSAACGRNVSATVTGSSRARFLVAFTGGGSLFGGTHVVALAQNGVPTGSLQVGSTNHTWPAIGCGIQSSVALVVHSNLAAVQVARIDVDTMTVTGVMSTGGFGGPNAIATTDDGTGRYAVAWQQVNVRGISTMVVRSDLTPLSPEIVVSEGPSAAAPSITGDGIDWAVAYQKPISSPTDQVACAGLHFDPSTGVTSAKPEVVVVSSGDDDQAPEIARMGDSYLVAFERRFGGLDYDIWAQPIDLDCGTCGTAFQLATSVDPDRGIGIASQVEGGGEEALITWINAPSSGIHNIRGRRFAERVGSIVDLGGGCGDGGRASARCAAVGGTLTFGLAEASPLANGALLLGASVANSPCGPCTLVPVPTVAIPALTDATGGAAWSAHLADPAFAGGTLFAQWVVVSPGGCGALSFSDGHGVTIE